MGKQVKGASIVRPRRVSISDVAKAAGVHASTVSRVLNVATRGQISQPVIDKVLAASATLGYRANAVAAGLRTSSSRTVGFIVHDISDPIYSPILRGIEDFLKSFGYMVFVGNTGHSNEAEVEILDRMAAQLVDGVILGTTELEDALVEKCISVGLPAVTVMRRTSEKKVSSVVVDNAFGMRQLVELSLKLGHRDIALISGPQQWSTTLERHESFISTMLDAGIEIAPDRICFTERLGVEEGKSAARTILEVGRKPPTAIICANDLVAIGAISMCREKGLVCPDDISVTGFNDIKFAQYVDPPLTTIHTEPYEIGLQAAECLLDIMSGAKHDPEERVVNSKLVQRDSLRQILISDLH